MKIKEINGGDYELSAVSSPPRKIASEESKIELTPISHVIQSNRSAFEEEQDLNESTIDSLSGPNADEEYLLALMKQKSEH